MNDTVIRKGTRADSAGFLQLLVALAEFERLEPPTAEGKRRIVEDVFEKKRANLLVAVRGKKHVGYALYFYMYSSFIARPTLYIEDLFVFEEHRKKGIGFSLFRGWRKWRKKKNAGGWRGRSSNGTRKQSISTKNWGRGG